MKPLIILATALLAVVLHWTLGWQTTVLAGLVGGSLSSRGGWFTGAAGVALGWAAGVVYTAAVAPSSFRVLLDTLGAFAGNIPGEALVGLTVLVGGGLGALGGAIGGTLRNLVKEASWKR